ncbi:MAG: Fe-S cluster assembly protein SufD [Pirellulales bacterium]|nr:Fe-S cluster assembly protein SufD [Pirellulales bacterium]
MAELLSSDPQHTAGLVSGGFSEAAFEAFLSQRAALLGRQEPAWLQAMRREAWQAFLEMDFPSRQDEEWQRTDIRLLRLERFGFPQPPPSGSQTPPALLAAGVALAGSCVHLNGWPLRWHLEPQWQRQGVLFGPLDQLLLEHEATLRPWFYSRALQARADKFAALHAAGWSAGTVLYVPPGVVVDQPLHTLSALGGGTDLGHQLVVLGEGARATLLAETAATAGDANAPGLHSGAVELLVGPRATLRYVNLQDWGRGVWHFAHHKALVEREGRLQWTIGALGGRLAKVNQHVALVGEGAEAEVNGVMFTEGRQQLAYHTLQHHEKPRCKSDLLYKGALQDRSRLVWRGMIHVDPGAVKTHAYQRNDNLMLSQTARVDSIPGLEILADDVVCTHGATTGNVDESLIFYACSRGLTRREAVRMIVSGFFQQVFDRIPIESVREALGQAIGRRVREYT